jgi:formamidase
LALQHLQAIDVPFDRSLTPRQRHSCLDCGVVRSQATLGPGERIVVAPLDITALRHERATRRGDAMLAHLRTEAYPIYAKHVYPPASDTDAARHRLSYELNNRRIDAMKHQREVLYAD